MTQSTEENTSIPVAVFERHHMRFICCGVVGFHQMLRLRRVMLQVVQFVGHNKILKSLGNRVLRINDTDGEVHVFAMAVKEPIEHAVIPFLHSRNDAAAV